MGYGDSLAARERVDGEVPVFGSNGRVGTHEVPNTRGPVIVVGRKGSHGKLQYSSSPVFAIDTTFFIDERFTGQDLRWLYYALSTLSLDQMTVDVGVPGLSRELAYGQLVSLPPLPAQRAIADFLDAETARIDALMAKKRRLGKVLDARFREVARASVTGDRHLEDPLHVEPEDLPTGWRPIKLGWDLTFGSGTTPRAGDERFYGEGTPWIVTSNLRDEKIVEVSGSVTERALAEHSALRVHPSGSLAVAMYGATVGRLGITTAPATVNQACCVIHSGRRIDIRFLFLYLLSHRDVLLERSVGAGQPNISQEILRSIRIAAPPREDQARIVDSVFHVRDRTRATIAALTHQLALLQEHRQALITAAVTGELDVATPA